MISFAVIFISSLVGAYYIWAFIHERIVEFVMKRLFDNNSFLYFLIYLRETKRFLDVVRISFLDSVIMCRNNLHSSKALAKELIESLDTIIELATLVKGKLSKDFSISLNNETEPKGEAS